MADSFKIKGSSSDGNSTLKIGQDNIKELAAGIDMNNTKIGNMAEVIFTSRKADGSVSNNSASDLGINTNESLTGTTKTEITNDLSQKKDSIARLKDVKSVAAKIGMVQAAKTMTNYVISNYGNWTQDPMAQARINNTMVVAGSATNIIAATAVGGIYGFIAAVVSEGVNFGINAYNRHIELKRSGIDSQIQYSRAGISARTSGGR